MIKNLGKSMVHIWETWCKNTLFSAPSYVDSLLVQVGLLTMELGWPVGFWSRYSPLGMLLAFSSSFIVYLYVW